MIELEDDKMDESVGLDDSCDNVPDSKVAFRCFAVLQMMINLFMYE